MHYSSRFRHLADLLTKFTVTHVSVDPCELYSQLQRCCLPK